MLQLSVVVSIMVRTFKLRNAEGTSGVVATDYSVSSSQEAELRLQAVFADCHRSHFFPDLWNLHLYAGSDVWGLLEVKRSGCSCDVRAKGPIPKWLKAHPY